MKLFDGQCVEGFSYQQGSGKLFLAENGSIWKILCTLAKRKTTGRMALIIGTEYCKIDSNGRFKFPIALKRQLETEDNRFVVRQSVNAGCLELWPYTSFVAEVEELQKKLNLYNIEDNNIMRQLTRANVVELDNSDRMLVPPERKSVLGDAKEIVLQSTGRCMEIWDRSAYDKMNNEAVDLASIVDKRLGYGVPSASDAG